MRTNERSHGGDCRIMTYALQGLSPLEASRQLKHPASQRSSIHHHHHHKPSPTITTLNSHHRLPPTSLKPKYHQTSQPALPGSLRPRPPPPAPIPSNRQDASLALPALQQLLLAAHPVPAAAVRKKNTDRVLEGEQQESTLSEHVLGRSGGRGGGRQAKPFPEIIE